MKIFLDYDDLLVGLTEPWFAHLRKVHGLALDRATVPYYAFITDTFGAWTIDYLRDPAVYDAVSPLPGAKAFLSAIRDRFGEKNVHIVSASCDTVEKRKERHAALHFGIDPAQFIHTVEKHRRTSDGILVDDNPGQIVRHIEVNRRPGIVYTGAGAYGWANPENYRNDPWLADKKKAMASGLFTVCPTYDAILAALSRPL